MGKALVAAGASGGTGNGAHRRTKGRPWERVQARQESCGLPTPTRTRHACHLRMSREDRQWPQPLAQWAQAETWCSRTWEERQQPRPPAPVAAAWKLFEADRQEVAIQEGHPSGNG